MHVLLINPRGRAWSPNVWVPLGLLYVASALEQEGHSVEIVDLNARRMKDGDLQRRAKSADIVGVTGMITEYQEVLRITDIAKKTDADVKVVLGGPLATTLPQELLQASRADFVVVGEGERTIVNLVSAVEHDHNPAHIKGIAYRRDDQIIRTAPAEPIADLNTIAAPARHLIDMNRYAQKHFENFGLKINEFGEIKSTNLITSRGCPYSCTFCFKDMWGHKWRARSAENIIEEMQLLYKRYGMNGFLFNDDTFVLDRKRVFGLCSLVKEKGLDVVWYCNGRANLMTKELLMAMHDAGCRGIAYGIESGNQHILDSMKKNITLKQVRNAVRWAKEAGIHVSGYFMIGMLDETKDTIRETIAFARELELDFYGFSIATPLPNTELYSAAVERGLLQRDMTSLKEWGFYVNVNLTSDCTDKDLITIKNRLFKEFNVKKFGRYYVINPTFLRGMSKVILSLQSISEARELVRKARGIIWSYRHKA